MENDRSVYVSRWDRRCAAAAAIEGDLLHGPGAQSRESTLKGGHRSRNNARDKPETQSRFRFPGSGGCRSRSRAIVPRVYEIRDCRSETCNRIKRAGVSLGRSHDTRDTSAGETATWKASLPIPRFPSARRGDCVLAGKRGLTLLIEGEERNRLFAPMGTKYGFLASSRANYTGAGAFGSRKSVWQILCLLARQVSLSVLRLNLREVLVIFETRWRVFPGDGWRRKEGWGI